MAKSPIPANFLNAQGNYGCLQNVKHNNVKTTLYLKLLLPACGVYDSIMMMNKEVKKMNAKDSVNIILGRLDNYISFITAIGAVEGGSMSKNEYYVN